MSTTGPRPKKKSSRAQGVRVPDDVIPIPGGLMARFGRFIETRRTTTPEEHEALIDAFIANAASIRAEQERLRSSVLDILRSADCVDLLGRATLTYLHIDPDTFRESETDRSPAHVEYLALQALGADLLDNHGRGNAGTAERLTSDALEVVREMFLNASMLMMVEAMEARRLAPDDPNIEYRLKTRLESLSVRGVAYGEHLERVIHGCLDPFDQECRNLLGFTSSDALTIARGVAALLSGRRDPLAQQAEDARTSTLRQYEHERRRQNPANRHLPAEWFALSHSQAKIRISLLALMSMFEDSRRLVVITPEQLAAVCSASTSACHSFLDALTCAPEAYHEDHHRFPAGAHPLQITPALRLDEGYFIPVPSAILEAIRPRMEELLQSRSVNGIWERYLDARGTYLERESTRLLATALPGSESWSSIPWRGSRLTSDLDGLVTTDDFTARVQCKSGRLTAAARRGAPERMKRDITQLILNAQEQHRALDAALTVEDARELGFSADQAKALKAPIQLEVIVSLDDITVWATETHKLEALGSASDRVDVPWVLSLTDLMAVTDLLQGAQFIHYLLRRQRMERTGLIEAHDELDWVGNYISEGLFFDDFFRRGERLDGVRLLSYTEAFDAWYFSRAGVMTTPAPKPTQKIPPHLEELVRRLETDRPEHWVLGALALVDGDHASKVRWNEGIARARNRRERFGWSSTTQVFSGRVGVTLVIDSRRDGPTVSARAADYCRAKAQELDEPNWIGIGEGATGGLFVIVIQRDSESPIGQIFRALPQGWENTSDLVGPDEKQATHVTSGGSILGST